MPRRTDNTIDTYAVLRRSGDQNHQDGKRPHIMGAGQPVNVAHILHGRCYNSDRLTHV